MIYRLVRTAMLAICAIWLAVPVDTAAAQPKCPEGKQWNGDCVNAGLAATNRKTAIIFSQPKISQTTLPILPADDLLYRYPNQLIPFPSKPAPAFSISP